ncbi:MAG: cytidylate kinase-like family protein [Hespellia sp.]|nr:cytidylate kinase-like family protein [Hespellia sp.]
MSTRFITIGRQFGSNGRLIGHELAGRLGINCYDKSLIKLAAEHTDIPYEDLKLVDERKESGWKYLVDEDENLAKQYRYEHIDEVLFQLQSKIIKDLASSEDCIFVGRCADYVLKEQPHGRHVFLYAPDEVRIRTAMERYQVDAKKAASLMKKVDKDRSYYYNYYTDQDWNDWNSYDMAIDTNAFAVEEIVDILELVYKKL